MKKTIGELQAMIEKESGYYDSRFFKKHDEWCTILILPKTKESFWGFGKDQDSSHADAIKQYGAKRTLSDY